MGTIIIGAIVLVAVGFAARSVYRSAKHGSCAGCGGECPHHSSGGCTHGK